MPEHPADAQAAIAQVDLGAADQIWFCGGERIN